MNKPKGHKAEGSDELPAVKESTPPAQQQQQQPPAWEKASAPSPGLSTGMASLAVAEGGNEKPAEDSVILDGSTPPAQTIIFENTNFRGTSDLTKGRGTPPQAGSKAPAQQTKQSTDKPAPVASSAKSDAVQIAAVAAAMGKEEIQRERALGLNSDDSFAKTAAGSSSAGSGSSVYSATSSGLQLAVGSNKAPMSNAGGSAIQRIQHIANVQSPISPSAADLNMKIASVKKVRYSAKMFVKKIMLIV